ncbi:hypothetical protein quinque_004527 [Culex quinquefasciatus]
MSIATYEEVLDLPNHPEKLLIDVRGVDEVASTGAIPTAVNIPLDQVEKAFAPETTSEEFLKLYGVAKPDKGRYIIMSCRTGRRSQMALDTIIPTVEQALQLPADEFKAKYGRDKPTPETEVIFSCKLGGRAQTATNTALGLGFTNAKNYKGSWTEWAAKQGK